MENIFNKRNWEILFSSFEGPEKKAVELVNCEMGTHLIRDDGVYTLHTLTCKNASTPDDTKNSVIIGTYDNNKTIRKYIEKSELAEDGYVVKIIDKPENPELKLVIITAIKPREVFYGAVDFVDDYFPKAACDRDGLVYYNEIFTHSLPDYYNSSSPVIKKRNIFTWGHPIADYRDYIDKMARLKFNELIIWNDFVPVNAKDVVSYAHEYGMRIIWGFAWGWSRQCSKTDISTLDSLTDEIIKKYTDEYAKIGGDGIYFQSFTEMSETIIGKRLVADVVTEFVNKTADKLLKIYPDLLIQFGLHANSVKEHIEYIKNTDKRVDIIWENCGIFPYENTHIYPITNEGFDKTVNFTKEILNLRPACRDGVLYKGQLTMDWCGDHFVHQSGPFIMGMQSKKTIQNDTVIMKALWKEYQNSWLLNGKYAYEMTNQIVNTNPSASIGLASQLANGIWFPAALLSQILWECDKPYDEILDKVLKRRCIDMV